MVTEIEMPFWSWKEMNGKDPHPQNLMKAEGEVVSMGSFGSASCV